MTTAIQGLIDAVCFGSLYALFALGIALIFGVMGLMNLAHGELIMIGSYALVLATDVPLALRLVLAVVVVIGVALLMERIAFRPVRDANPATLLVTSFAVSFLLQNAVIQIVGSVPRVTNLSTTLSETFAIGDIRIPKLNALTVVLTAVLLAGLVVFLSKSRTGVQMRAAAEDFTMARLLGVRGDRVVSVAFALSGLLAAVAAILLVGQTGSATPTVGSVPVLYALVATIIGGIGSLLGAVLGGYLLGAVTTAFQLWLPIEWQPYRDALTFTVVFAVLVWRPQGLIMTKASVTRV